LARFGYNHQKRLSRQLPFYRRRKIISGVHEKTIGVKRVSSSAFAVNRKILPTTRCIHQAARIAANDSYFERKLNGEKK